MLLRATQTNKLQRCAKKKKKQRHIAAKSKLCKYLEVSKLSAAEATPFYFLLVTPLLKASKRFKIQYILLMLS